MTDRKSYLSIHKPSLIRKYIKKSEFIGRAFPIQSPDDVEKILEEMRSLERDATHYTYAYVSGVLRDKKKFSDDGEPQGTAGLPILEVIEEQEMTQILLVVIRYFGGIKLGASGLLRAYRSSAQKALEAAGKALFLPAHVIKLQFAYDFLGKIEYYQRENSIKEIHRSYTDKVEVNWILSEKNQQKIKGDIMEITAGQLKWQKGPETWLKKILDQGQDQ